MYEISEYNGYRAQIKYDSDDKLFAGRVSGIEDSLNFHGSTPAELEEAFHQSIDSYLQMCAETGKTPDRGFGQGRSSAASR